MNIDDTRANLAAAIVDLHPHANAAYRIHLAQAIEAMIDAKISAQHPSVPLILTGSPAHAPLPGSCFACKQLPCACARAY